jgi:transcriptional regulator with XRE-family HTH domain
MRLASAGIGKRLFEARIKRDMTMDQLAAKAKISQATISKLERGLHDPASGVTERLALALGVDPCWLAYGTGEQPKWEAKELERR